MKSITIIKSGKKMKELPWTEKDESFFRQYEGYMLSQGMTFVIDDPRDTLPANSFIALVRFLGKTKTERHGAEIRWASVMVMESSIQTVTVGAELWIKIPVDKVDLYFTVGLPNRYLVMNTGPPADKWIHHFGNIVPAVDHPTTIVTVASDEQ